MTELLPQVRALSSFDGTLVKWIEYGSGYPIFISSPLGIPFSFWEPLLSELAARFCFYFVMRRGLWGTARPVDEENLGVKAHGVDIACIVEHCGHRAFGMLGFCSGVAPMVESLQELRHGPEQLALFSGRFCRGRGFRMEYWMEQMKRDVSVRHRIVDILTRFGPMCLREALTAELQDLEILAAHIKAIELSRSYEFEVAIPDQLPTQFFIGERDYEEISASTRSYVTRLGRSAGDIVVVDGAEHFYLRDDVARSRELIEGVFGGARAS